MIYTRPIKFDQKGSKLQGEDPNKLRTGVQLHIN
jgi:hypothetical protein